MGICFGFLPFFDAVHDLAGIKGSFLSLGSQQIQEQADAVEAFSKKTGYHGLTARGSLAPLLQQRYGITGYDDADMNDHASIHVDLTRPIFPEDPLWQRFATIYNGGTTEHIFDVASAFKTIHNMMAHEGICIHISPLSWLTHGFYNFTLKFYQNIIHANHYTPLVLGYYFMKPCKISDTDSLQGFSCTYRGNETAPQEQARIIDQQIRAGVDFPQNTLVCAAYRKVDNKEFVFPYDVAQ